MLVIILNAVQKHGSAALSNSYFEMPLAGFEVEGLNPYKVEVALNSSPRLYSLVEMWANVVTCIRRGGQE